MYSVAVENHQTKKQNDDYYDIAENGTFNAFEVSLPPPRTTEPYFEYNNLTNPEIVTIVGVVGRSVYMMCKVHNLGNKTVRFGITYSCNCQAIDETILK